MFGVIDLWFFIVSGLAVNIAPGPDMLYLISRSVTQGFRAGFIAALGACSGTIPHIFAAAFGLSAILATSPIAFDIIKFIGALYLLYMALTMLLYKPNSEDFRLGKVSAIPLKTIYIQSFLTSFLNPYSTLFFFAFVPQFIAPDATNKAVSFIILGAIFNVNAMFLDLFLIWSASVVGVKLQQNEFIRIWLNRGVGVLFAYFAIRLLLSEPIL